MSLPDTSKAAKTLNLLTICRKAGKVVLGFDAVKDSVYGGKAFCVCTVSDLSPKTTKEAAYISQREGVPLLKLGLTMEDIWRAMGQRSGVISICDQGFAKRLAQIQEEQVP